MAMSALLQGYTSEQWDRINAQKYDSCREKKVKVYEGWTREPVITYHSATSVIGP